MVEYIKMADTLAGDKHIPDGELLAILSELLLGYREGKTYDMIHAVVGLKRKAHNYEINKQLDDLVEKIDELYALKDEIMSDA